MKARIPKHREFLISFPEDMDQARQDEAWGKLNQILEDYKKEGKSVYTPTLPGQGGRAEGRVRLRLHHRAALSICPFSPRLPLGAGAFFAICLPK